MTSYGWLTLVFLAVLLIISTPLLGNYMAKVYGNQAAPALHLPPDQLDDRRTTPARSPDQRIDALNKANEVRTRRAQLKRDLKAGRVTIGALLLDPPPFLETAKVLDILLALPKIGKVKATKILQSCRVSPSKTFGGLNQRQRAELAGRL
jgi:hypothetical protein